MCCELRRCLRFHRLWPHIDVRDDRSIRVSSSFVVYEKGCSLDLSRHWRINGPVAGDALDLRDQLVKLVRNGVDAYPMEAVQVLMTSDLEDGSGPLSTHVSSFLSRKPFSAYREILRLSALGMSMEWMDAHNRVSQEIDPDPIPPDPVFGDDLLLV